MTPTLLIDLFSEQRFFISNLCTFFWDTRYMKTPTFHFHQCVSVRYIFKFQQSVCAIQTVETLDIIQWHFTVPLIFVGYYTRIIYIDANLSHRVQFRFVTESAFMSKGLKHETSHL